MNNKNEASKVLIASATNALNKSGYDQQNLAEVEQVLQELAKDGSPQSRYEISEVVTTAVNDVIEYNENMLSTLADVKNVSAGSSLDFKVKMNEVTSYIQAVGGTPYRSKVLKDTITLAPQDIAARPYANYAEMATGRVNFTDLIQSTARSMTLQKIKLLEETIKANVTTLPAGAKTSGTGVVKDTFNELFFKFRRMGATRIVGDIALLNKLSEFSGFNGVDRPSDIASEEIRNQAYVGTYLGATVHEMINPPVDGDMNPLLSYEALYVIAGNESPLKFVNQGGVRSMEVLNHEDESYEIFMRQTVAAGFVNGSVPNMGIYTVV